MGGRPQPASCDAPVSGAKTRMKRLSCWVTQVSREVIQQLQAWLSLGFVVPKGPPRGLELRLQLYEA
ncbi:hypothetical protein E2C01_056258 [Portunus trituberculatus]|uniref:Uncharacterized protein n=1 Tax=Portunus trituberculatus TaxID=210409 RepID=A0A5B7GX31_PORTR|nr:hypothetical protein [Portunus trituberculatus]